MSSAAVLPMCAAVVSITAAAVPMAVKFLHGKNEDPDILDEDVEETATSQLQTTTEGPPKKRSRNF
eukprot:gene8800-14834_t